MRLTNLVSFTQNRNISFKSMRTWYASLVDPATKDPPYNHIVQIGDPTLREKAEAIPANKIQSPEVKFLIQQMKNVFSKYQCVGMAASQIGVPFQIIMVEFSKIHAKHYSSEEFKNKEMKFLPLSVIINPSLVVTDYTKIVYPEACESIKGYFADVCRYKGIKLQGLNEDGVEIQLEAVGWLSRIIQHEMDHLNGVLYTDKMDPKTLTCGCWEVINQRNGGVELPFRPK